MTEAARAHESTFAYRGHAVVVRGPDATRAWLAAMVEPWLTLGGGDAPVGAAYRAPSVWEAVRRAA